MPTVKVIKSFKRRGEIILPGRIIEVPEAMIPALTGFIEIIPRHRKDQPGIIEWLAEALAEIDRAGRPWPLNFLARMSQEDRDRINDLERRMDDAAMAGDEVSVKTLVVEWREFLLDRRRKQLEGPSEQAGGVR